jgi:site-specific DNA recombinase
MERPELDRLRDDAQKGVFDAVLINDVDRLARDVALLGVVKRDLERHGIKVIFRKLPSDTSPTSNLMINILGSFAEFERELIADRTRRGRRHKIEVRKQYLGSNTAYGYSYIPADRFAGKEGVLEIAPEEAIIVRQMFEWVDEERLSARRVLNRLNELNIRPRRGASKWAKSSVLRILKNEMYAGVWHYNKYQGCEPKDLASSPRYRKRIKCSLRQRPRNEWIPLDLPENLHLVPRARWERVQQQLARNLTFSPRNEKHTYLLKGLVRCGGCRARYVGDPSHGRFTYRCMNRCKKVSSISERILNDVVVSAVKEIVLDPTLLLRPLLEFNRADEYERVHHEKQAGQIEREEKRLNTEEQRILDAYRTDLISASQLGQQLEKLRARRAAIELARSEVQEEPQSREQNVAEVKEFCTKAAQNLETFTEIEWREFLRIIVQEISFYGDSIKIKARLPVTAATQLPLGTEVCIPHKTAYGSRFSPHVQTGELRP